MSKYARRVDGNHRKVIEALEAEGMSVADISAIGRGLPDTLVGFEDIAVPAEIKNGDKPPSKRKLTKKQREWFEKWKGPVVVLENVEQARAFARGLRNYKATLLAAAERAGSGRDMG